MGDRDAISDFKEVPTDAQPGKVATNGNGSKAASELPAVALRGRSLAQRAVVEDGNLAKYDEDGGWAEPRKDEEGMICPQERAAIETAPPSVSRRLAPIPVASGNVADEGGFLRSKWLLFGLGAVALLLLPAGYFMANNVGKSSSPTPAATVATPRIVAVTALGRIEPEGEVIKLSAGSSQGGNALIEQLQVRQGDDVQVNQVIAVLDSRARLQAAFDKSLQDVRVAEANLARVKQGVKQGEILAQEAAIARWEEQLRGEATTAEATLAKLRAQLAWEPAAQSAKIRALTAQLNGEQPNYTARLRRLDAQLQNAQREYERYKSLYQQNAIAASRIDEKQLQVETVRQQIEEARSAYNQSTSVTRQQIVEAQANQQRLQATLTQQLREAEATYQKNIASLRQQILEAKANLERLREVRPVDVSQAEAEVARSIAASQQARADLGNAFVRSSIAGKVFKINSRPGEIPNNTKGIIEVAQTDRMHVVAEVYESDINRVRLGQTVAIKSETGAFPQSVRGTVYFIGSTIGKKDVLSSDPAADVDARVVEVKIRIDSADNAIVQNLTNAKVLVNIDINNTGTPSLPTDPASPQ